MLLSFLQPYFRQWRLVAMCGLLLFGACFTAFAADPSPAIGSTKEFWVWDLNVMPPGFRRAKATLRATGAHSLVYVEDQFWEKKISQNYVDRLKQLLEVSSPFGAIVPAQGVIPFEEANFGSLPKRAAGESRLIVLFADLGKYKDHEFDGFFNVYDQQTESEAQKEDQHSNEANIIYLNGLRRDESYTNGVISHELQHLLSFDASGETSKDNWLSETLAEGAMLATGHFTDQPILDQLLKNTGNSPLVSPTYVSYGPQLLFASFLLDFTSHGISNLTEISRSKLHGRDNIEAFFEHRLGNPQTFDAIYSSFVSYVFNASNYGWSLPISWDRPHGTGLNVGEIAAYKTISSFPANIDGWLYPYSFVAIDLAAELPDTAVVRVETLRGANVNEESSSAPDSCSRTASALWKPVSKKRIAIYAVGCEPKSKADLLHFRLIIADQASPKGITRRTLTH
ncbi:MAG: hypothetical protein ACXWQO_10645 [Bdellovibrionota bacterium]